MRGQNLTFDIFAQENASKIPKKLNQRCKKRALDQLKLDGVTQLITDPPAVNSITMQNQTSCISPL